MGRLLERLLADSQPVPAATPATLATLPAIGPVRVAESQESQGVPPEKQRAHLLALAADEWVPEALVHGLTDADVRACNGLPDTTLRAYLRALEASGHMDAGMVPPDWGEPVARTCEGCGPVLLWSACPPVVKSCPWCFRRKAGKVVPRPAVACGDCRHYLPDPVNPPAGMGGCRLGNGRAYWPMKLHRCTEHRKV